MKIIDNIAEVKSLVSALKQNNKSIGFVPTMGALHEGHFSLIDQARQENDIVICSIFVNPTQFNNKEDLVNYPVTIQADTSALKKLKCDIVFIPSVEEMYPAPAVLKFDFGSLETVMEGANRPGHFNGVGIVVSKLFNIVEPHQAYFGQKDLQQFAIISQFVSDLSFPVKLTCCPTVREEDGLAKSSRNMRLSKSERTIAPLVHQTLKATEKQILNGNSAEESINVGIKAIHQNKLFEVEYLKIINRVTLQPLFGEIAAETPVAICIAAHLGSVRLIDNIVVR